MPKRLRVFAGPNGSGKSTIENLVSSKYNIGNFINADQIERTLRTKGQISFNSYGITITQAEFNKLIKDSSFNEKENLSKLTTRLSVRKNLLKLKSDRIAYSYLGAILSELIRNKSLDGSRTFSFETVMSHPGKLEFMKEAKIKGFKTYLYFVSTESPEINVGRIQTRVAQGGHDVPVDKIKSRYKKSLGLLAEAIKLVDRAFIFDNSGEETLLLAEKDEGELEIFEKSVPRWFDTYVIKKLG